MSDAITDIQARAGAQFIAFGGGDDAVPIPEEFGAYEAEYASIRQRVGIMHLPQRGLVDLRGQDVKDFLHRLLTQDIHGMAGGQSRRSFLLNQKGRIVADLYVHHGDVNTWLESDAMDLPRVRRVLEEKLFAEDVAIDDWTPRYQVFALHGPASVALMSAVCGPGDDPNAPADMPGTHHVLKLAGAVCTVSRRDTCGVPGFMLYVPGEHAAAVYAALLDHAGFEMDAPDPKADPDGAAAAAARRRGSLRGRPIGWQAFNTARIEAGSPLFHVDFGTDSIPAETGKALFEQAVSMTKGCYVGQEIVARMHNLGHPKRVLVGFEAEGGHLPVAGTQVCSQRGGPTEVVGGVTSSTISVTRGHMAVGFAVVKWGSHEPGTAVLIPVEGQMVGATIRDIAVWSEADA